MQERTTQYNKSCKHHLNDVINNFGVGRRVNSGIESGERRVFLLYLLSNLVADNRRRRRATSNETSLQSLRPQTRDCTTRQSYVDRVLMKRDFLRALVNLLSDVHHRVGVLRICSLNW